MIFISYAKEDADYAHRLFAELHEAGLEPWMDKPPSPYSHLGLQIGQRWRPVIEMKIRSASRIVLILTPTSVVKRGFVQNEFRLALELMSSLPQDDVLVLPILSEELNPPNLRVGNIELSDIQWGVVAFDEIPQFVAQIANRFGGQ
ncbi:toll/interleukin-1 receptor domain-containing protein [Aquabacter cavernae]|uniref:toll/interleukin-1 receptor domain-containing protein n=1 Tax=Aquabacter cavernae TaxID=2496029 RepID=UPI000F8E76FD|nr:toll/interleukin-1 receptor domain-containing protein [Aquabacter cavernae]